MNTIKFLLANTLRVVTDFDESAQVMQEDVESFAEGELVDVTIIDTDHDLYCDLQFGNGHVAMQVFRPSFEVVK